MLRKIFLAVAAVASLGAADPRWLEISGSAGPGKGKHVVLVSGDEEYRSEEALPQLAKILASRHGFRCTVLFAIDPKTGEVNPDVSNIPGLEALRTADLVIIATRFRALPDEQMKHIVDYLDSGRPIIGLRTATHGFNYKPGSAYEKYSWNYKGTDYEGGFGRQVLGETWVEHHGKHGKQATRGRIAPGAEKHPILRGIRDGEIWGPTDVYRVRLPLPGDSRPVLLGEVVEGMSESDPPAAGAVNNPMMPIAWTRRVGKARVFTTTMGAATDLPNEGFRRMLVNAVYWALGMEAQIPAKADVALVGEYRPSAFSFGGYRKGVRPADLK